MPHHPMPIDRMLNLWRVGATRGEIYQKVRRPDGQPYSYGAIYKVVTEARKRGDPRAVRRR